MLREVVMYERKMERRRIILSTYCLGLLTELYQKKIPIALFGRKPYRIAMRMRIDDRRTSCFGTPGAMLYAGSVVYIDGSGPFGMGDDAQSEDRHS